MRKAYNVKIKKAKFLNLSILLNIVKKTNKVQTRSRHLWKIMRYICLEWKTSWRNQQMEHIINLLNLNTSAKLYLFNLCERLAIDIFPSLSE